MSTALFLYGTLCDPDLLAVVLDRDAGGRAAVLPGYAVHRVKDEIFPGIHEDNGSEAPGLLLEDLSAQDLERLDFYEGPYAYERVARRVRCGADMVQAQVFMPQPGRWHVGPAWDLDEWQLSYGPLKREAALEIMSYFGRFTSAEVDARMSVIETRAQARLNARNQPSPSILRRGFTRDDVDLKQSARVYSEFFALDEMTLTHKQFAGGQSAAVDRAVFVSADAATVLPYDPRNDTVLLIEQFRVSLYGRGDPHPWSLEAIAGRIDPLETAEQAAHREASEEAGITLRALHHISSYYTSPGVNTEYLISFLGIADLDPAMDHLGGLDTEAEDIRAMVIPFESLMATLRSGEAENAPLILSALWLERERDRLREIG